MKIALGTVQFGMRYGVANQAGQVPEQEVADILAYARAGGVDTLDTATAYGESEERLGRLSVSGWKVVSKMGAVPAGCTDIAGWFREEIEASLGRLGIGSLHALLLHDPKQLLDPRGDEIYSALCAAKIDGLTSRIGISIYDPSELDLLTGRYTFDLVQAPFNVLDHRLLDSGWLDRLRRSGVEVHARSIFLQGLLLMTRDGRPEKFRRWDRLWAMWEGWLQQIDSAPLQACLAHALSFDEIGKVIVGVDSRDQLGEIMAASRAGRPGLPAGFQTDDEDLLNPSRWANL